MKRTKKKENKRDVVVIGVDSETQAGPPISIQFHSYDQPDASRIIQVNADNATELFFKQLDRVCRPQLHYRLYGHYLEFDMVSFFWALRSKLVASDGSYDFTYKKWHVVGCYGKPTFARLTTNNGHLVEIVDSALWFRGSLDAAAEQYCPDLRKLKRPEGLGELWFSVRDSAFASYAMRDAEIAARLGALIEGFHQQQSLRPSMSLASQAAQIFRTHYIQEPIVQCPAKFLEPAISAYHGGKNNLVKGAAPAWHLDNAMYDISSAYPWAMTELPNFTDHDQFSELSVSPRAKSVPTPGVYKVTGKLSHCDWPIFFTHDFKPLRACRVEDLWVHGYELNEALASGEFTPTARITGCYYADTTRGESATARFSRDMYKKKTESENPIDKHMYKISANCLSGKFIQTREQEVIADDGTITKEHVAGGLFNPFIAGSITAHTRATMHRLEHLYKAHHTATDGIIADRQRNKLLSLDAGLPATGLGSLNEEMRGNVCLLRTKLYIGYTRTDGKPSRIFKEWKVKKYALHGFQGSVGELEEMIASGRRWYIAPHRIGLRESIKHGTIPNYFVQRQMALQVGKLRG